MSMRLNSLGCLQHSRFERLGILADIDNAIETQTRAVTLTPQGHPDMPMRLSNLGISHQSRFTRLGAMEDINSAIDCQTRAVSLTPEGHADLPVWLNNLGDSCHTCYKRLGQPDDINKAIEYQTRAVSLTPDSHAYMPDWLNGLGTSYHSRYELQDEAHDLTCAIDCFRRSALSSTGPPHPRFLGACQWAKLTTSQETPECLSAFQKAMSLIPHEIGDLATRASAAAISAEKYDLAVEWLEQGRSIVWNQAVQLRTPLDDLFSINPSLANNLKQVAGQLDNAGTRSHNLTTPDPARDPTTLEQVARQHHRLAERYDGLVEEVRKIPGFCNFLQPRKASDLLPAAQTGPVVLINPHPSRSDALVLLPGKAEIKCIPLPNLSYDHVTNARGQLDKSLQYHDLRERNSSRRPIMPRATHQKPDHFESVLGTLWTTVAKPILKSLQYMPVPFDLPHVTWCLAGPLSFLPLHASRHYEHPQVKLADFVISSYTPTISALLPSATGSVTHSQVLAIGLESTTNQSPLPGTKAELSSIKQRAIAPLQYAQLDNDNATIAEVLAEMEKSDWVHLACHASQDTQDPTGSGFLLHDGMLSLATIMQKSFKNKGLAFPSACQTAKGDEKLPEEAVHLASGMLFAGYPSVIATMWSVKDHDAPVIADQVYAQVLKDGRMNHGDASKALHIAVNHLRNEIGGKEFARWVPYIHIGI